jgi:DNA-binding transcriptional regulator YdaS (Cro superfamily)
MRKVEAVNYFGTAQNLAKALGITKGSVSQWGEFIPKGRACELEIKTGGKLKYIPQEYKQAS